MKGFHVAEQGHVVNILPPIDITGGKDCDIFSMENYAHATIIVQVGVSAAAFTKIELYECDDFTPSSQTAIAYSAYKEETAAGDTLGALVAVTSTGITPSANDNIFYVIELDAQDLTDGYPCVQVKLTNGVNAVIASAIAILSGSRHGSPASATAIA